MDHYQTDRWIMSIFETWFDPCPFHADFNGLDLEWCKYHDQVFVNPPYSNPKIWVIKAIEQVRKYRGSTVVLLLKHDSSTEWFRLLHEAGAHFMMINKRLKHRTGKSAAFPSVLAVLTDSE